MSSPSQLEYPYLQDLLPELQQVLGRESCALLHSPPGTGKTTQVPLVLLKADWLQGQKILLLEPRRLAAKAAAHYMAQKLGEPVGRTVGYRVRLETRVSAQTQIEVVTEGVLTRMLQSDPALEGVGLVIFDEFHERSLQADLGLALCRESQQVLRPELRLLIMSATLATEALSELLQAPVLRAEGQQYPVELRYLPPPANHSPTAYQAQIVRQTLAQEEGSLLVFLPGAREIRRLAEALTDLPNGVQVRPLFGNLSPQEQEQAIQPAPAGQRKVVLATNLAETSLTIEGVRGVIDVGLERVPRFDPVSGMTELKTQFISRASAEQRRGRAGRLEPGFCLRLWAESDWGRMAADRTPEMALADLAPLALELARWGCADPGDLSWLDPPPATAYAQALTLLQSLSALDAQGRLTAHGKALAGLPLHPRLGHMLLQAKAEKLGGLAVTVAALLEERDLLAGQTRESDLTLRLEALAGKRRAPEGRRERLLKLARQLGGLIQVQPCFEPLSELAYLLGLAYPERLAQRRKGGEPRFLLAGGRGAFMEPSDALAQSPWLAVAQLDGNPREARIFLAAALTPEQLERLTQEQQRQELAVRFNPKTGSVQARQSMRYGALELSSQVIAQPDPEQMVQALCLGIRQRGIGQLSWSKTLLHLRQRVDFVCRHAEQIGADWPAMDDESLTAEVEDWLAPFLNGIKKWDAITPELLKQGLEYRLGPVRLQALQKLAPATWTVPSGSQIRIDYSGAEPVLAVRLQEVFGLETTPCLLNGQVPLLIHLLSPAQRPVQVTRDLASFWRETYPQIKKELKGRYPKHYWPEDPHTAEAIRGVRRHKLP